jgi:hypothetical protein
VVITRPHHPFEGQSLEVLRHARMRKECGRISDQQLHQQCMASFDQYEPAMVGSSTPPRHYRQGAGY